MREAVRSRRGERANPAAFLSASRVVPGQRQQELAQKKARRKPGKSGILSEHRSQEKTPPMPSPLHWFDKQTGLLTAFGNWLDRPMTDGPAWRFVWPATIAFLVLVQMITGLAIWMYYSPGTQSSWESVYYLQYHVLGGWLLRAIHFYTGQAALVLLGVYLLQLIFRGLCAFLPSIQFA